MAEKLRKAVFTEQFSGTEVSSRRLAISLGVSELVPQDDEQGKSVLSRAEQALAVAKKAGRNRVYVADESHLAPAALPS